MGLEKYPIKSYEIIIKNAIEIYAISTHKVQVNKQIIEQIGTKIKNYHTILPFLR